MSDEINYIDLGYNNLLDQEAPSLNDPNYDATNAVNMSDGINSGNSSEIIDNGSIEFDQTTLDVLDINQDIKSRNFVSGSTGWRIQGSGDVEFGSGIFRGAISAATIDIGGSDNTSFHVDIDGNIWSGAAAYASAPFKVSNAGALTASSGVIGGFTITASELYGGIIKTAATVEAGSSGVIMDTDGLRGYDAVLGETFNLPTDGSAPSFASGTITETIFDISTNAVLRTSTTVGDGTANSAGILINNTGIYGCEDNQTLANGNIRILTDGSAFFKGTIEANKIKTAGQAIVVQTTESIQDAIDEVYAAGGGEVLLAAGTHKPGGNLTLYSNIKLIGQGASSSIIDFETGAYGIIIQGSDIYTTGTISITQGTATVTGSGTTFTAAMVGRNIMLGGYWYTISAFTNATTITIVVNYNDASLSGENCIIADPIADVYVQELFIKNSGASAINVSYAWEVLFMNLLIQTSGVGITITNSSEFNVEVCDVQYCYSGYSMTNAHYGTFQYPSTVGAITGNGVTFDSCTNISFIGMFVIDSAGDGMNFTDSSEIGIMNSTVKRSGDNGIEFVSGNSNFYILGFSSVGNTNDGIKMTATTDECVISAGALNDNGGWGVNIAASTCDNNIVRSNHYNNNTLGDFYDGGTGTNQDETKDKNVFGGSGADGVLSVASGTTNLDADGSNVLTKQYTSINIASGATLGLTDKNDSGTILILKCKGDVTIAGTIELTGQGANAATTSYGIIDTDSHHGGAGSVGNYGTGNAAGGTGGAALTNGHWYSTVAIVNMHRKMIVVACGSGGGAGGNGQGSAGGNGVGGAGGKGGGCLIIECAGKLNLTGTINVNGEAGSNGTSGDTSRIGGGGGGGGGAAGMCLVLYDELTANTGTINAKGGAGGAGGSGGSGGIDYAGGGGGAGGGCYNIAGKDGAIGSIAGAGLNGNNSTYAEGAGGGGGAVSSGSSFSGGAGGNAGSSDSNHHKTTINNYF